MSLEQVRQADKAVEQGIRCLENEEVDRAIECFTEAIRLNPESARALLSQPS
jgi:Flp pilus assembly protein TadD